MIASGLDMSTHERYFKIIDGTRRDIAARGARLGLGALSHGYHGLITLRNRWYDRPGTSMRLNAPVISVGNLTTGGTGKTPMTVWLGEHLLRMGRKPAVLSRGYMAQDSEDSDEIMMIRRQCPELITVVNPDRVAGGRSAIDNHGADVLLLDDGFQHRRLARDLDLVLIDATCPFGHGHLLPRGLLREPPSALKRADAVIITRCNLIPCPDLEHLAATIHRQYPGLAMMRASHQMQSWVDLRGNPTAAPVDLEIGVFAGIAHPESFKQTLHLSGQNTDRTHWFEDHHRYTRNDAEMLSQWAMHHRLDALVTTEKDAVKLERLHWDWPVPVIVSRVRMLFHDRDEAIMTDLLNQKLQEFSIIE